MSKKIRNSIDWNACALAGNKGKCANEPISILQFITERIYVVFQTPFACEGAGVPT
ncbi:MAG TPA: hypothetical protein PKY59_25360 [Pyrinomonadaceae bacterium]|nr:hypothetical protein [Pyrinomonadaceae bacterium]